MIPPGEYLKFGRQVCGSLDNAAHREWLVTDGLGGFAMGTVAGLSTRRYHGLLVIATAPPIGRMMGLAALDPVLIVGGRRIELAAHEWSGGAMSPSGYRDLSEFSIIEGVPRWRWSVGPVVLEAEIAMLHEQPATGIAYRLLHAGTAPVSLEVTALCTWRDVHGERFAGDDPTVEHTTEGFSFEGAYYVRGPGFERAGQWYRGVYHREEAARGLNPTEDVWCAGRFSAALTVGSTLQVEAWASGSAVPPAAAEIVASARQRFADIAALAEATSTEEQLLAHAADQFIVTGASGPTVVAGYPWFGDWSRDTMTSYEGLFLETGRHAEGRTLLLTAAAAVSEGMLANTADAGGTEYNTVDGTLWFLHAIGRHIERTHDHQLGVTLRPTIQSIIDHHLIGTRFGIRVDVDGLVTQGAHGWALTWMDARVGGNPVTARRGKPVEVNALWVRGLDVAVALGLDVAPLADQARASFTARFIRPEGGLYDVIDGPDGDDSTVRPNQLIASALGLVSATTTLPDVGSLITSVGLRSLPPEDRRYLGQHRGDGNGRDSAYHQGTVWPWWIGPYVDSMAALGGDLSSAVSGLLAHLGEWGLGSVSETTNGDTPHDATGCPFQAWSVAELFRAARVTKAITEKTSQHERAGPATH